VPGPEPERGELRFSIDSLGRRREGRRSAATAKAGMGPAGLRPIKPGEHRFGRKKGTPNKVTSSLRDAILAAAAALRAVSSLAFS
jgi:hypothetical protein